VNVFTDSFDITYKDVNENNVNAKTDACIQGNLLSLLREEYWKEHWKDNDYDNLSINFLDVLFVFLSDALFMRINDTFFHNEN